jgi:hypothetical protein
LVPREGLHLAYKFVRLCEKARDAIRSGHGASPHKEIGRRFT